MNANIEGRPSQSPFSKFLKTPKGFVLAVLILLTLLSALNVQEHHGLVNTAAAMVTALVFDFTVGLLRRPIRWFSDGGVITGLIVGGILSATAPWYAAVITTAIALASKHLLKTKRKPIFNPAALGLLIATVVFSSGQSWWGSLSMLPGFGVIFLLLGGFLVVRRVNKLPLVFAFLGTYFALLLIMALLHLGLPSDTPADALRVPFINSALFLAFFMITDPPTSPAKYKHQVYFGIMSAAISIVVFATQGGLAYLYIGLLVSNGWKAWISRKPSESQVRVPSLRTSQPER